jgi:hypothetical protein
VRQRMVRRFRLLALQPLGVSEMSNDTMNFSQAAAARAMVAADLYGMSFPARELGFKPDPLRYESRETLHGKTHREVTIIMYPDTPSKHSTIDDTRCFSIVGPLGSLHGYIKDEAFSAVCEALGVLECRT